MKKLLSLCFLVVFYFSIVAQEDDLPAYKETVKEAWRLYTTKEYKKSAEAYAKAFDFLNRKAYSNDRYNAACSYALAGIKDSALHHLYRLADGQNYSNLDHLLKDTDLSSLHEEERWEEIVAYVKKNKQEKEKDYNIPLKNKLDSIYELDQGIRKDYPEMVAKYDPDSKELKAYWAKMKRIDEENEKAVLAVIDEHGWLGSKVVGGKANMTLFLVIQHAPIKTQEKYLPIMRQAVKDKKARASSLALLEDRVLLRNGKKQIYGSQVGTDPDTQEKYVMALEDPLNVDERRSAVNLPSLAEYLSSFGIVWDAEQYVKDSKRYEDLLKESKKAHKN